MCKQWLLCVFLGTLGWAQTQAGAPTPANPTPAGARPQVPTTATAPDTSASVASTAAVVTVTLKSSCPGQPKTATVKTASTTGTASAKTPAVKANSGECKTVYTKEEFERLASAASPNMTPQLKRQLSNVLPRFTAMSQEAEKKGLDKTPRFKEMMKFLRMQALSQELQRQIQDDAGKVADTEITTYYNRNPEAYEQFNLDRLFIPRFKQAHDEAEEGKENDNADDKDEKLTEEQKKAKQEKEKAEQAKGEEEMTKLAETLQARAAAGEDFMALQKEAFAAAGMKIEAPTINLPKIRRTGLPQGHAAVFDLKAGEVSQAINDAGGHYVYKVIAKDQLSLDQVKEEIIGVLKNQHIRDAMDKLTNSFSVETNEAYFGPPPPTGARPNMPMPHLPNPRVAPSPTAPSAQPQTQAPGQPQSPQPN